METVTAQEYPEMMFVKTTQRTPTFFLVPNGGWQRGEEYRTLDRNMIEAINAKLAENVKMVGSSSRYLEFYFESELQSDSSAVDMSEQLRDGIKLLMSSLDEFDVYLRVVPNLY